MAWNFPLSKTGGGVEAIVRIDIQQEFLDSRNSFQFHDKRKRSGLSGNCLVKSYTMTRHEMLGTKCWGQNVGGTLTLLHADIKLHGQRQCKPSKQEIVYSPGLSSAKFRVVWIQ